MAVRKISGKAEARKMLDEMEKTDKKPSKKKVRIVKKASKVKKVGKGAGLKGRK